MGIRMVTLPSFLLPLLLLFLYTLRTMTIRLSRTSLLMSTGAKPHVDVAVIGSGVGGLVCAGILAANNLSVTVFEKNSVCGGRMQSESYTHGNHSYRWDVGPSLLLLPDVYRKTFSLLGGDLEDHLELLKVDPFYRCFFGDGTVTEISPDEKTMMQSLEAIEAGKYGRLIPHLHYEAVYTKRRQCRVTCSLSRS